MAGADACCAFWSVESDTARVAVNGFEASNPDVALVNIRIEGDDGCAGSYAASDSISCQYCEGICEHLVRRMRKCEMEYDVEEWKER